MSLDRLNKPKRTLVAINCEHLEHKKYDLTYLEGAQKLSLFLFYRGEVHFWFDVRQGFSARTFLVPDAEQDMAAYIAKVVTFEVGKHTEYRKVVFIDPQPERMNGEVQFLRDRGISTEAYDFVGRAAVPGEAPRPLPKMGPVTRVEPIMPLIDPLTGKKRRKRKVKMPTDAKKMELVMRAVLRAFVPGETYKKTQISPIIHRETEMNVKDLFPYKNLTGLYRYLVSQDIVEELDKKTFRVLTNQWEMPADAQPPKPRGRRKANPAV